MKKREPMIDDYGISLMEYEFYKEYSSIKEEELNENLLGLKIFLSLLSGWSVWVVLKIIGTAILCAIFNQTGEVIIVKNWGEAIALSIFFVIIGVVNYCVKRKKILKKMNNIIKGLDKRKMEMCERFHKDCKEYERECIIEKNKIKICKEKIDFINKESFFEYNTKKLKGLVEELNENYKPISSKLFDFSYEKLLIKCVGVGDFLCKIDIQEMGEYLIENAFEKIVIYSLVDIKVELFFESTLIEYIDKYKLKNLLLEKQQNLVDILVKDKGDYKGK